MTANGELNKELSERAKVSAESDAALNREIANLATQNAALNRELADYARGGDSYYYIHLNQVGTELQEAKITHIGEHPVWNFERGGLRR